MRGGAGFVARRFLLLGSSLWGGFRARLGGRLIIWSWASGGARFRARMLGCRGGWLGDWLDVFAGLEEEPLFIFIAYLSPQEMCEQNHGCENRGLDDRLLFSHAAF